MLLESLAESAEIIDAIEPELGIALFRHQNTRGEPMELNNRPWLIPIYTDKSPYQVIMKSVQCGLTERAIIRLFSQLINGRAVLYVLPTLDVRNTFVSNRIDRMIDDIPFYKSGLKGTDNTGLKFLFTGQVKFIGANTRMAFKEYPADDLIIDELDECDQDNLSYAYDRLASAKNPTVFKISNPTISGNGIHAEYEKSDKKTWHIKCEHCGEWQPLDWFVNMVKKTDDNEYVRLGCICRKCGGTLDRHSEGEWVAEFPSKEISGRHISKLFTHQTSLDILWGLFLEGLENQSQKQVFYNSELGLPYSGEGDQLTYADIENCKGDYFAPKRADWAVMGVDVGSVLHVAIDDFKGTRRRALFRGVVPDWEELERIRKRYNCEVGVIDALPEIHKAREYAKNQKRFYLCQYTGEAKAGGYTLNKSDKVLSTNRTESLDDMTACILAGKVMYPKDIKSNKEFMNHMIVSTRILDVKRKPVPLFVWEHPANQPDHFFHAENYVNMAAKIAGFGAREMKVVYV